MPLQRNEKEAVVESMTALLKDAEAVVVADYRGLTVAQTHAFRRKLRDHGATLVIVKNTLAAIAFENAGLEPPEGLLDGPSGFVFMGDDLSGPAKAVLETADDTGFLTVKGGLMGTSVLDAAGVEALSKLPSRAELQSSLLGVLQAPQRQLVTVINASLVDLVGVLKAYSEKEPEEEAA